jgi:hypothetical protein
MKPEQIYRILLKAYPRRYRERYSDAMQQCFRDQLREADTTSGRLLLWLRIAADLMLSVPLEHLEGHRRPDLWRDCRRPIFFARYVAAASGAAEIGVEHLLAGLLREDRDAVEAVIGRARAGEWRAGGHKRPARESLISLTLSSDSRRAMARAAELAESEREKCVGSRHLLAAILEQGHLPR